MSLLGWLQGVTVIAVTLIPFFLIWACAGLWLKSRSAWALAALAGASSAVIGIVLTWVIGFFIHYSSGEVMMAQNANPNLALDLALDLSLSLGIFVAVFALVGYARSLPDAGGSSF
jgi:hypothetical protein